MRTANQDVINHIIFIIDDSASIGFHGLDNQVPKVFDSQVKYLARRSQELNQETRVSLFLFSDGYRCVCFDKDVLRLPSLEGIYKADGDCTQLIDSTIGVIRDFVDTPQKYGNHSFLVYVITDGEDNRRNFSAAHLEGLITGLEDNWTLACMVPNQVGVREAKRFGFPAENISVWDANSVQGLEEAGAKMTDASENFMQARSKGMRGTKSLFRLDTTKLTPRNVARNLGRLTPNKYIILPVKQNGSEIRTFCELTPRLRTWAKGHAFYELSKRETIQGNKEVCIFDKNNEVLYSGESSRELIGLPSIDANTDVKASPEDFGKYKIFVQSNSVNRKLIKNTSLLYLY